MPLFPIGQTINYNYINNLLENNFCWQVTITITRIIPLRIIYVMISWTMVHTHSQTTPQIYMTSTFHLNEYSFQLSLLQGFFPFVIVNFSFCPVLTARLLETRVGEGQPRPGRGPGEHKGEERASARVRNGRAQGCEKAREENACVWRDMKA